MGNTVDTIVISYDINHTEVKEEMQQLGYSDYWKYGDGPLYQMPNTTLWHKARSSDAAINDIKNVCYRLGVNLDKAVAVRAKEFAGIR